MRHAVRDSEGQIVSLHREPVAGSEPVALEHPDVQAFLRDDASRGFAELDADLVRVLEDLIDALIRLNVLRITDLPLEAQNKLFARKHFRDSMQSHALKLFEADEAPPPPGTAG